MWAFRNILVAPANIITNNDCCTAYFTRPGIIISCSVGMDLEKLLLHLIYKVPFTFDIQVTTVLLISPNFYFVGYSVAGCGPLAWGGVCFSPSLDSP